MDTLVHLRELRLLQTKVGNHCCIFFFMTADSREMTGNEGRETALTSRPPGWLTQWFNIGNMLQLKKIFL